MKEITSDIVVIGGGLAGVCAAIASSRLGNKVCLINNRPVLGGNSFQYDSVWADANSNLITGKLYVTTTGSGAAFSVVDLETKSLFDCYTEKEAGRVDEILDYNNIEDFNLSG